MRSIETEEKRQQKQKRNRTIMVFFLILIMLGSTAGYAVSIFLGNNKGNTDVENPDGPVYNGQYWVINKDGRQFYLRSGPEEVKSVPVSLSGTTSLANYIGQPVFVASDNDVILQEIGSVLNGYASRIQKACYGSCDSPDLPEKDCSSLMFVWNASATEKVYQNQGCVFIEGTITAADAFLYKLLGY